MTHDAFISYNRADEKLAAAFETGLEKLAKPLLRLRALDVFRDRNELSGPLLGSAIEAGLSGSRWLIVFASPTAVASAWCVREQQWWLDAHGTERVLLVLTEGEIVWDRAANDFDAARSSAIAPIFAKRFAEEPLWIDLRWAREVEGLGLRHPRFREAVVAAAAPIRGQRMDQIDSADLRQLARNRMLVRGGIAAVALAAAVAAWQAVVASRERDAAVVARSEAERQRDAALARTLALESAAVREREPAALPVAALLALESLRIDPGPAAQQALRAAVALLPHTVLRIAGDARAPNARVRALAFSPDAKFIATGRDDGIAHVIEIGTGRAGANLQHGDSVTAIAFSADGKQLATVSRDGHARLWAARGGEATLSLKHGSPVATVALHPRDALMATGSDDGMLRIWSLGDGSERTRVNLDAEVRHVAFSPDGRSLGAIATNGCAAVLDVASGRETMRRCGGQSGLAIAWSPDGKRLAVARGDHAAVLDARSGEPAMQVSHADAARADSDNHLRWITDVAWSPDGTQLATSAREGTARLWHVERGSEALRLAHGDAAVAFAPGGEFVATASHDGTARLWDARTGGEVLRAGHAGPVEVVGFSRDGQYVASGASDGSVAVWRTGRADEAVALRQGGEVSALGASADGTLLASAMRDGRVRLWAADGTPRGERGGLFGVRQMMFGAGGRSLAVAARGDVMTVLDTARSLEPIATIKLRSGGDWLISPDHLVAWDRDGGRLRVWSTTSGAEQAIIEAPRAWRIGLAAGGRWLWAWQAAANGRNGRVVVRTLPQLESVAELPFEREPTVALLPDGKTLIATAWEATENRYAPKHFIEWWNLATGQRRQRIEIAAALDGLRLDAKGEVVIGWRDGGALQSWSAIDAKALAKWELEDIRALRFAPSAGALAIGTGRAVHIVDPRHGDELARLDLPDVMSALAWAGDATRLYVATHDGLVSGRLWRGEELRALACERIGRDLSADEWSRHMGSAPWRATCTTSASKPVR